MLRGVALLCCGLTWYAKALDLQPHALPSLLHCTIDTATEATLRGLQLFPNLVNLLGSESNVVHSYAAIAVERLLASKVRCTACWAA